MAFFGNELTSFSSLRLKRNGGQGRGVNIEACEQINNGDKGRPRPEIEPATQHQDWAMDWARIPHLGVDLRKTKVILKACPFDLFPNFF